GAYNRHNAKLLASFLLGCLPGLIPNSALRYLVVTILASLAAIYAIYLKYPSTKLRQLQEAIATTKEVTRSAQLQCLRDHLSLTAEWAQLLAVQQSALMIQCRVWETGCFSWKKYRLISNDIAECSRKIKTIRAAVQNMVEAEHQRKLAEDINETESILASVRSATGVRTR
ncbi:hypothetical protein C8R44DRAFT_794144, partial [Mycena epipterygia]